MPKPRKESAASRMMKPPMPSEARMITGPSTLGRMWRKMMRVLETPSARAAVTKSSSFKLKTSARTTHETRIAEVEMISEREAQKSAALEMVVAELGGVSA